MAEQPEAVAMEQKEVRARAEQEERPAVVAPTPPEQQVLAEMVAMAETVARAQALPEDRVEQARARPEQPLAVAVPEGAIQTVETVLRAEFLSP